MATFHDIDFDFSNITLFEGFQKLLAGPVASIGYGYKCVGKVIPGPHWTARWVNTQGMGNHGVCFIKPVSKEARALVRGHTLEQWCQMGLKFSQARALYHMDVRYKHELIARVIECVKDSSIVEAFKRFPGVGPGKHNQWFQAWEEVVSKPLEDLSWWRRSALIRMVNAIA